MDELLQKLIAFKNTTANIAANEQALLFFQQYLRARGVESELVWRTQSPSLEWGAALEETTFLCNTHIDVVPAPDSSFTPKRTKTRLIGRGAADTKAMVSIILSLPPDQIVRAASAGVRFVLVSDEETGGDTTKALVPLLPKLEFALFGEPTQLKLNTEAKGIMQVRVEFVGKNAHGSQPWVGKNAIISLAESLTRFLAENAPPQDYTWDTTCNFSQIQGGTAINQVPDRCDLLCDVRYRPGDSAERIMAQFHKHFGAETVSVIRHESEIFTSPENPYIVLLQEHLALNDIRPELSKELASSDARHCTKRGVASVVFGPIGGQLHEDDEWVDLASLQKAQSILQSYIQAVCSTRLV